VRVPREWVWVVILVAVLVITLFGCADPSGEPPVATYKSEQNKAREEHKFDVIYLDWRGIYLIEFEGHDYLKAGDFFRHTVSCRGIHDE